MTDIASNLDKVIEKLDGMTSEVLAKNYGMDIASKVDHIAKQLDYVQAGGGSGGGVTIFSFNAYNNTSEKTREEVLQIVEGGGIPIAYDGELYYHLRKIDPDNKDVQFATIIINPNNHKVSDKRFNMYPDGTVGFITYTSPE